MYSESSGEIILIAGSAFLTILQDPSSGLARVSLDRT